jgi:hypothetical protein
MGKKNCSTNTFSLIIHQNKKSIKILTCEGWFHHVKSPLTCQQTEIDICNMRLIYSLPFHSVDDLRTYSKSSLTLNEWKFNLSFSWGSCLKVHTSDHEWPRVISVFKNHEIIFKHSLIIHKLIGKSCQP